MPAQRLVVVMGTSGSGKTALLQRFLENSFLENTRPTVGLDADAGRAIITVRAAEDHKRLATLIPEEGLEMEFWELGGREFGKRELPRGRHIDGLVLCYESGDRASFQRASHALMNLLIDRHFADSKNESVVYGREIPRQIAVLLCGTKVDEDNGFAVGSQEISTFVRTNRINVAASTSARTGHGVQRAFFDLAAAMLETDRALAASQQDGVAPEVAESWSLVCPDKVGHKGPFTSPRGTRPFEPLRVTPLSSTAPIELRSPSSRVPVRSPPAVDTERLVEVFDQHGDATGTRSLGRCLERGLRHRAVHIWLTVPRTGALLLRRYAPDAAKHPGRWGPTVHGEVLCYGIEGNGHGAELSAQAAARSMREQLGIDIDEVADLEHTFSCTLQDGKCVELLDIYMGALKGEGLPPLHVHEFEELDWAFFGDVFSDEARRSASVFHVTEEYIMAMFRPLRARVVKNDVLHAFGPPAVALLGRDEVRGLPEAGGELNVEGVTAKKALRMQSVY